MSARSLPSPTCTVDWPCSHLHGKSCLSLVVLVLSTSDTLACCADATLQDRLLLRLDHQYSFANDVRLLRSGQVPRLVRYVAVRAPGLTKWSLINASPTPLLLRPTPRVISHLISRWQQREAERACAQLLSEIRTEKKTVSKFNSLADIKVAFLAPFTGPYSGTSSCRIRTLRIMLL